MPAKPVLYQYLTDVLFRMFIQILTRQEGNALRYAAGYVCRHLWKKIKRENSEMAHVPVMLAHIFSIQLNQKKPSSFCHYNKLTIGYTYSNNHGSYHAYPLNGKTPTA